MDDSLIDGGWSSGDYDTFPSNSSYAVTSPSVFSRGRPDRLLYLLAPLVGLVTNGTFQITAWRNVSLRRNVFGINLIILSYLDMLSCICYTAIVYQWMALYNLYFPYLFVALHTLHTVSTVLIVLISWERYKAISRPLEIATSETHLAKMCVIHLCWILFTSIIGGPVLLFLWRLSDRTEFPYFYVVLMQFDVIALLATIVIYISVGMYVRVESKILRSSNRRYRWYHRREINLCIMAWINAVLFFTLLVSQHVLPAVAIFYLHRPGTFLKVQLACSLVNASINPIIYNIFGTQYRKAFVRTVLCCKWWVQSRR